MSLIFRFFKPPIFAEEDKNRTAGFLNVILWAMIVIFLSLLAERMINGGNVFGSANSILAGLILVLVALQVVMRIGYVRAASFTLVAVLWAAMAYLAWNADGLYDIAYIALIVAIMISSLLLGWQAGVFFTIISIVIGWVFAYAHLSEQIPINIDTPLNLMRDFTAVFIVISLLIYLNINSLSRALQQTRQSNRELQELSAGLEKSIVERTRDLELAVEVGRNLTSVRDLDTLLRESSELIRERFNLYHVQIYLADSLQQTLTLRSGTGRAANELLARRHNLAVTSGSINGSAALNKKAVIVTDTRESSMFRPNPLLPDTRSEMAVPLLIGDRVLGVLDLQSAEAGSLSEEVLPAFETLASQLAVSIDNANLFAAARQAQSEVEAYLQRLTREGWSDYLDAIARGEKLAYVYDPNSSAEESSQPVTSTPVGKNVLQMPISIANEQIGVIQIEADDDHNWSEDASSLVSSVAQRVAQQVENLRLLGEAERYRTEAEIALRRATFEGWQAYMQDETETVRGYLYDQNQVHPLPDAIAGDDIPALKQELQVRGETVGHLELYGVESAPETTKLLQLVSARLSDHLENLRLGQQTEKALAETAEQARSLAALNEISRDLSVATNVDETFAVLARHMASVIPHDFLSFAMAKPNGNSAKIIAVMNGQQVTIFEDQPIAGTIVEAAIKQRQIVYLADISQHDYADTNVMAERAGARSVMIAPLLTARGVLGGIDLMSSKVDGFNTQDQTLLQQIARLVASTLENQQLFAEAQKQAEKEKMVNLISQKIQGTVTIESALETAVVELGKALSTQYAQIELAVKPERQAA